MIISRGRSYIVVHSRSLLDPTYIRFSWTCVMILAIGLGGGIQQFFKKY